MRRVVIELLPSCFCWPSGCPKIWWWIPKQNMPRFKRFAESLSGSQDLYTKAVAPFVLNKSVQPYEHRLSLAKLKEFGARRVIQMPGGLVALQRFEWSSSLLVAFHVQQPGDSYLRFILAHPQFSAQAWPLRRP